MSEPDSTATIRLKCPHCDSDITANAEDSGTESTCPKCTHRIVIPPTSFEDPNSRKVSAAVHEVFDEGSKTAVTIAQIMAKKGLEGGVALEDGGRADTLTRRYLASDHSRRYQVGDVVGSGGMGAILAARDMNIWRHVAMKVMLKKEKTTNAELLRFLEEAQVTGQLEHPNIVPVHELGIDSSGSVYYTMKLIRGRSLKDVIEKIREGDEETIREFPLNRLMNIYLKLCDAVAFAHSKGVIHRDLKPENVMLGDYGEVLVLDWGLAKIIGIERDDVELAGSDGDTPKPDWMTEDVDSFRKSDEALQTMTGTVLGTPSFMAPEQAHAQPGSIQSQTDIYALGGILYNLLTLNLPIRAKSMNLLLMALVTGKLTPPQDWNPDGAMTRERAEKKKSPITLAHCPNNRIPDSLAAVAMKALALAPEDRYANVKALQADIEAWQAGFATEAEGAGLWRQLVLLVSRHKRECTLAGVAALILVVFTTLFMISLKVSRDTAVAARAAEEKQRLRAEGLLVDVKREKNAAVQARETAERQLYYANIAFAHDCITGDPVRPVLAERKLAECRVDLRNFEWRYLKGRLNRMGQKIDIGGWRKPSSWARRVCISKDARTVYLLVQQGAGAPDTTIIRFTRMKEGWSRAEFKLGKQVAGTDLAMDDDGKFIAVHGHKTFMISTATMKSVLSTASQGVGQVAFVDQARKLVGFMPSIMGSGIRVGCIVQMESGKITESHDGVGFSRGATGNIVYFPCLRNCRWRKVIAKDASGTQVWSVPCPGKGEGHAVESPNGRYLAVIRGETFAVYRRDRSTIIQQTIPGGARFQGELQPAVLTFSRDSRHVCVSGENPGRTYVFNLETGQVHEFPMRASQACFGPGSLLALSERNNLFIIDAVQGKVVQTVQGHDANIIALGFEDDVTVVSISGERILRNRIDRNKGVINGVFLSDGRLFAGGAVQSLPQGGTYAANSGSAVAAQRNVAAWQNDEIRVCELRSGDVSSIRVIEAGRGYAIKHVSLSRSEQLVLVGSRRGNASILSAYRRATGTLIWQLNAPVLPAFGLSEGMTEDDKILCGTSFVPIAGLSNGSRDAAAILAAGKCIVGRKYRIALAGGMYEVFRVKDNTRRMYVKSSMVRRGLVALSADESLGAFVANETDVLIYNLDHAKQLQELRGTREKINAICISPDTWRIATFDRDSRIRIWDVGTGREMIAFSVPADVSDQARIRFLDDNQLLLRDRFGKQILMKAGESNE